MQNQFDSANYPDTEPEELIAGDRWAWTRSDITAAYPTDTYTLKYELSLQAASNVTRTVTAGKVDSAHVVETTETQTSVPGDYQWRAVIVRDSDSAEITVDQGFVSIRPAFDAACDTRSWVSRVLQALEVAIEGGASNDKGEVEINGRRVVWRSYSDLLNLEAEFRKRYNKEVQDALRKSGKAAGSRVLIGMSA